MKKYLLYLESNAENHAGSKATEDCASILAGMGYEKVTISKTNCRNKLILNMIQLLKHLKLAGLKRNSILVLQHPQYMRTIYLKWIHWLQKKKQLKLVVIIHDIESLRHLFVESAEAYEKMDNYTFQIADCMIAHNETMKRYLVEKRGVPEKKVVALQLFDYLADVRYQKRKQAISAQEGIVVAGNLAQNKAGYIYHLADLDTKIKLQLYGNNWTKEKEAINWTYHGSFAPDALIEHLNGSFGLVWDGDSLDQCEGTIGTYLQYNNPHKVSLYAAAELPIIIWEKAALADFVTEHGIGIAVDSLKHLDEMLQDISAEEYRKIKENIRGISLKVRQGAYLTEAINTVEEMLKV